MIAKSILGALLALGFAASAQAAMIAPPVEKGAAVTRVAEGCGPGWWRGPGGRCHPMAMGRACPPGYHLGPERQRCWPN
jgi:hypothetical protein